jgi:lambda repressor-like predicted transcriptional regulator
MDTEDIKTELFRRRRDVSMASIARELGVSRQVVNLVVSRKGVSQRIAQAVASAIGREFCDVFPEYSSCRQKRAA